MLREVNEEVIDWVVPAIYTTGGIGIYGTTIVEADNAAEAYAAFDELMDVDFFYPTHKSSASDRRVVAGSLRYSVDGQIVSAENFNADEALTDDWRVFLMGVRS